MIGQNVYDTLVKNFTEVFKRAPEVVAYAPGRVEILGNHTDYNEGLVLSAAINYGTFFALAGRADMETHLTAGDIMESVVYPTNSPAKSKDHQWSNYVKGVQAGLNELKSPEHGVDAMFLGNIPLGSGLSSSAALEMSAGLALAKFHGITLSQISMAKIGQAAEHKFAGVKCGLLDQISSLAGKSGSLVMSDFRSLEIKTVPVGPDACFMLFDTHAKHKLADGVYNERREACERAASYFTSVLPHPVRALRDVSWKEWSEHRDGLDDITARRAAHPIGEDERVLFGVDMLKNKNLEGFGHLMFESHDSSRKYFENSCPELDTLVDAAKAVPGILGARLSGGGFGGSVVALVNPGDAELASVAMRNVYGRRYGVRCDSRLIECSDGARVVFPA